MKNTKNNYCSKCAKKLESFRLITNVGGVNVIVCSFECLNKLKNEVKNDKTVNKRV